MSIPVPKPAPAGGGDNLPLPSAAAATLPEGLRQSAGGELLAMVLDRAPPFCIADGSNRLLFANPAFRAVAGDQAPGGGNGAIARVFATGETAVDQFSAGSGGAARHFNVFLFPIPANQRPPLAVGALMHERTREVQALNLAREQKQRLHDILRSTSDWVWETDAEGRLTFISDRVTAAVGIPPAQLRGKTLAEIGTLAADGPPLPGDGRPAPYVPFRDVAFSLANTEGGARHFSLSAVPMFDPGSGAFTGYRGTATDVSERLAAEEKINRYQIKLESTLERLHKGNIELEMALKKSIVAAESKNEFLATMSHELRTPLNAIIGFSEIMSIGAFGALNERYNQYVADILKSGNNLLGMIDEILQFACLESGRVKVDCGPVAVGEVVDQALQRVQAQRREKKIVLGRTDGRLDTLIFVDTAHAAHILHNLLDNAVKFTPDSGLVGVSIAPPADGQLRITVWDTGPGVPENEQAAIFDRFQQIHGNIFARRHGGIGLGLTLARELARAMRGDLELESSSSQGSRFTAVFPLA